MVRKGAPVRVRQRALALQHLRGPAIEPVFVVAGLVRRGTEYSEDSRRPLPQKDNIHAHWEMLMSHATLRRRTAAATATAALAAVAFAGPASAAISSAPSPYLPGQGSASNANAQGIIMSDGRICNPRWGC